MEKKRKNNKNPELTKISSKLFTLRRARERELLKKNKNEDLIKQIDKEIEEWIKKREDYHKANGDERGAYPRKKTSNGYYTITSSSRNDAKLAEELHYPDIVVKMLFEEQDEKKRMRILEQARLGTYGKR